MISKDECIIILKKSLNNSNFKLLNFQIKKASDDNIGYLGEYFNLITEFENDNSDIQKLQYFIKTIPQSNLEHKKIVEDAGVFKKEERIYKLFEEWNNLSSIKFHPNCFLSKSNLIVLEDLSVKEYYQLEDGIEYNINQLKAVLHSLAGLHSLSIAYEAKNNIRIGDYLKDELFETSVSKDITWFLAGLEAVRAVASKHPKFQTVDYQNFIENNFYKKINPVYDMVNASLQYQNVLCHRDVWGHNIFFKNDCNNNEESISSILVDYQTCRYCPPIIDILFLLHLNVKRKIRNKVYEVCLKFYHQKLEEYLINLKVPTEYHISKKEIFQSYNDLKLFGVVYDCIAATIVKLPKGYLTNLKKEEPKKYFKFSNVSRNDVVLEFLKTDDNFREYLFEAVEELFDVIY